MAEETPPSAPAIPWWQSKVLAGVLVSLIMQLLAVFHVGDKIAEADLAKLIDLLMQLAAILAVGYAAWKRARSQVQPITPTQAAADRKNAAG